MTSQQTQPRDHAIAVVSGADGENGHLEEFRTDPVGLMQRVRDECDAARVAFKAMVGWQGDACSAWKTNPRSYSESKLSWRAGDATS